MTARNPERRLAALEGEHHALARLSDEVIDQRITDLAYRTGFGPAWEASRLDPVGGTERLMTAIRASF